MRDRYPAGDVPDPEKSHVLNLAQKTNRTGKATMGKISILREFWDFLRIRKKFWLAPIVIILLLLSLLIVLTQGSALAPFIYALF